MLLTSTTDSIDVVLGATATTNQLHLISSYNNSTASSVTPAKTVTVTNDTTPVNLVPAPSSGDSRQLRYASIFNADTVSATVTVRNNFNGTTRNVISTLLHVNDFMQYTHRTGWKVFNMDGQLRNFDYFNTLTDHRAQEFFITANTTGTSTLTSGNTYCGYMGRASGPYNTIVINTVIGTAIGGTVSWAELAIYKGEPSLASGTTMTRLGFIDVAQTFTQGAQNRFFVIPVSGVTPGDGLWCVYGISTTGTSPTMRNANVSDIIGAGFIQTAGNNRPSTNLTLTGTVSTSFAFPQTFWNGL
jgi:hypothetical protein